MDPSNQSNGRWRDKAGDIFFYEMGIPYDDSGEIEILSIGKVKFEGLTTEQAKILVEKR